MEDLSSPIENMKSSSVRRTSAADEIFHILHEQILSGKLKAGDRLPSQEKLARQLGVSRNTLREAVYKLTVMGLLKAMQGVGTIVCSTTTSPYMASLTEHLLLQPSTVREFLEARIFVERGTVRLAAERATAEDIKQMRQIIANQRDAHKDGSIDRFSTLDAEFHVALARASRNSVLERFLEVIRDLLDRFISEVSRLPQAMEKAIRFHEKIIDRIHSNNADGAEDMISLHLLDVVKNIEGNVPVDLQINRLFKTAQSSTIGGYSG
jgi:GntR family transcriptional regulator, transcriptional repressor for pyruvate dehydrogenase complex